MKAPPFKYYDPRSKDEVLGLLAGTDNACLLAGGQSLMPMLNFRVFSPEHVIDLNRAHELAGISEDNGSLRVGAMTRQCDLEFSDSVSRAAPLLLAALTHVGHRQTRNWGTLGGSLCHMDPSAELVTAAMALDATLIAESRRYVRRVPIAAWNAGYLTNALRPGEMLTAVEFPVWPHGHGYSFVEYARRKGDFAIVGVAALLAFDANGVIEKAAVAIGGCAAGPQRPLPLERALLGRKPAAAVFKNAARLAAGIEAHSDPYVKADYRLHLARVLTDRALNEAAQRAGHGVPH